MAYFFILPLWVLVVLMGLVLLAFSRTRFLGALALTTSTAAVLLSFPASILGLLAGVQARKLSGSAVIGGVAGVGGYVGGLVLGGVVGAVSTGLLTLLAWRRFGRN